MKFQVKSKMTPIVNRVVAEMTRMIGRLFSMAGIMTFKLCFMGSLERAMEAFVLLLFQSERLERRG